MAEADMKKEDVLAMTQAEAQEWLSRQTEGGTDCTDCERCEECERCTDCKDCRNCVECEKCRECCYCDGLRNVEYAICNIIVGKDAYDAKMEEWRNTG